MPPAAPNRRRSHPAASSVPDVPDDFPVTFHMPSQRSVRHCLSAQPPALQDTPMLPSIGPSASNTRRRRRHPPVTSSVADNTIAATIQMPPIGISIPVPDDFPTNFHVPSRRSVRRCLAAEPIEVPRPSIITSPDPYRKRKADMLVSPQQGSASTSQSILLPVDAHKLHAMYAHANFPVPVLYACS